MGEQSATVLFLSPDGLHSMLAAALLRSIGGDRFGVYSAAY